MSNQRLTVAKCLIMSMLPSLGLSMPSDIRARAGCPAGPNGPNYQTLVAGDTCQTLAQKFNTSTLDIENLNFAGPDCTQNFIAGYQVCISPPCNAYTVQSGDTCQKIADNKNVVGGLDGFYSNNPGINKPSCNNLDIGTNVCLSAPQGPGSSTSSSKPTTTSSSKSTSTSSSSASGTGIPASSHCTKTYTAVSGDTCIGIVNAQILPTASDKGSADALSSFYKLNPTVHNPACENLNIGQVYCVAGGN